MQGHRYSGYSGDVVARWREDEGVATWSAFLRAHAAVTRRIEGDLQVARDMSLGAYDVLLVLSVAPRRRLRMQELGERSVLSRSRVSRIVDELCQQGLVRREPCPDDRRATFAALTDTGRAALRRAAPAYLRGIERHFTARLDTGQLAALRRTSEALLADDQRPVAKGDDR